MPDIEIKRGYEVLPDNNVRFGIRVINNSDVIMSDVEVLLDYSESLFQLEGSKVQKLGTIPPSVPRTAKFILKPLGCIHKENISATIIFKDHQWKKHTLEMKPKEVHCVCPFLKEKSIKRADFLAMSQSGFMEERGLNFEGISIDKLVDFLAHTCKNRLYKVDEFSIENGKILYLAGDAVGEKAYYLLTAVVKEYEGLTQVLLRVNSDKIHGLNGFLNETLDNLRHLVVSTSAREIGIIKKEHVINIIDSVVQRSTISMEGGTPEIKIKDSMVQRVEVKGDEERKRQEEEGQKRENEERRHSEEERAQREVVEGWRIEEAQQKDEEAQEEEKEEKPFVMQEDQERLRQESEGKGSAHKEPGRSKWKGILAVSLVIGVLVLGYLMLKPGATNSYNIFDEINIGGKYNAKVVLYEIETQNGSYRRSEIQYSIGNKQFRGIYFPEQWFPFEDTSLDWIKDNTPENSIFLNWWDYGKTIRGATGRDVIVASPSRELAKTVGSISSGEMDEKTYGEIYGYEDPEKIKDVALSLTTDDINITNSIMNKYNSKYIYVTMYDLDIISAMRQDENYYTKVKASTGELTVPTMKFYDSTLGKLLLFNGKDLKHYRMVYESKPNLNLSKEKYYKNVYNVLYSGNIPVEDTGYIKIFEYIKNSN